MPQLRFLLRTAAFALHAALVYAVVLALLPRPLSNRWVRNINAPTGGYGHNLTRMAEARTYGPVDILFLGSSHAYRGFDPRIFAARGLRCFNLGSSGQTPLQYEVLAHRHLDHLHPRLVIIEVEPYVLATDGVEGTLDLLANGPIDGHALGLVRRTSHLRTWNAVLHNGAKQLLHGPPVADETPRKGLDTYVTGGYVERDMATNRPMPPHGHNDDPVPLPMQLEAMDRVLRHLADRGVPVLLVEAPVTNARLAHHADRAAFAALMRARGTYWDMNGAVALDDSLHFYDSHHLNQRGVELFNEAIIGRLLDGGMP